METSAVRGRDVFRHRLGSGATLVGEVLPGYASAAIGLWINSGSRDESRSREGAAHFVEHMVFKGTQRRDARDIALSLEKVGGYLEAFTTKESTCFYARALGQDQALAVDVLADLVSHPRFASEDLTRERSVILEEVHQVEDTPEELAGDLVMSRLWPDHIMGMSILGTPASIQSMRTEWVQEFHSRHYVGPNVVVGAVGNVDPEALVDLLETHLRLPGREPDRARRTPDTASAGVTWVEKDLSQLVVTLALSAPPRNTPESRAVQLLADILGGGMSSRLFQSLREDRGLVYSVQGYSEHFSDTGILGITLGVSPEHTQEALERLTEELATIIHKGVRAEELAAAKAAVRGSLLMGRESLSQRMLGLAGMEAEGRWYQTVEASLAKYEAVTLEDLSAAARVLQPGAFQVVVVGPAHRGARAFFRDRPMQVLES